MLSIRSENHFIHTFVIASCSLLFIFLLDYIITKDYGPKEWSVNQDYYSSIWCHGTNHTNRRCRMVNVCFKQNTRDFVFIHHSNYSIQSHIPEDRFSPTLLDLSSLINHNQYYFNYFQIDFKTFHSFASHFRIKWIRGNTFVFGRFKPDNLMHLLHDDILPLFWTFKELDQFNKLDSLFLVDGWPESSTIKFNSEIYQKLFTGKKIIFSSSLQDDELICFDEALVGPNRETIWYQYGFHKPQGPVIKTSTESANIAQACLELTDKFKSVSNCPVIYGLFVSRKSNRMIINEDELIHLISKQMPVIKIEIDSADSLTELIEKAACSQLLIGVHGSGLILAIFMQPGGDLIELFPFGINPNHYTPYEQLAVHKKLNYQSWVNLNQSNTFPHPEYPAQYGGIGHFSSHIQSQIKSLNSTLESHLCCDDPSWLYRIYQDTLVDLDDFKKRIKLRNYIKLHKISGHLNRKSVDTLYYPGKVENTECTLQEKDRFKIEWQVPWNLEYIPNSNVKYEILIETGIKQASSFFTSQPFLIVQHQKESFNFWIRCYNGPIRGPFQYSSCSQQ